MAAFTTDSTLAFVELRQNAAAIGFVRRPVIP
jgi:hypothetical protein